MILLFLTVFVVFCMNAQTDLFSFWQILFCGIFVSACLFLFACKVLGYSLKKELMLYRIAPLLCLYALTLLFEILRANLLVLSGIFKKKEPEDKIVYLTPGIRNTFACSLLANAITLTPGTITVHVENGRFTVHCLFAEFGVGLDRSMPAVCAKKIDAILEKRKV